MNATALTSEKKIEQTDRHKDPDGQSP